MSGLQGDDDVIVNPPDSLISGETVRVAPAQTLDRHGAEFARKAINPAEGARSEFALGCEFLCAKFCLCEGRVLLLGIGVVICALRLHGGTELCSPAADVPADFKEFGRIGSRRSRATTFRRASGGRFMKTRS